ncbi:GTP-binding protein GEM-like [Gigantopelta aegis]|uniref:GTP-binding protein GEM-like n=1 Tax=Gigantopelta aegis TaxID=1735272 RepID=UPI001B88897A|nr:GTP-binding protein GEM-like [Gigantopelta aegis]
MRSIVDQHHLTVSGGNQRHSVSAPHSRSGSFKKSSSAKNPADARPRTNSMPNCPIYLSLPDVISQLSIPDYDLCRVRSFKKTSKGLVNHGDTVRKMSINSLMSSGNTVTDCVERQRTLSITSAESVCNSSSSSTAPSYFRVAILGTNEVGKTSLRRQMMTSEYLASNSSAEPDDEDTIVSVSLDDEESMVELIDDPQIPECEEIRVDAYLVVLSVTDLPSFEYATSVIRHLRVMIGTDRTIILVANKTDLVRQRRVTQNEIRMIAEKYSCKFAETSVAINHQVDELLVGLVSQIRAKLHFQSERSVNDVTKHRALSPKRALSFLGKLFKHSNKKFASCDDLLC